MDIIEQTSFSKIPIDYSWSFADTIIKDTSYITHGYYTYPAKLELLRNIIKPKLFYF